VVRKALLESERWLTLKDNADRLAYVWLLLNVDDYANYSAERYRLMRAWRDFGITTVELVAKTLAELQDHDMLGLYHVDGRPFLHLMRLHNPRQWWVRIYPQSPFDGDINNDKKQWLKKKCINDILVTTKRGVRGKGLGEVQKHLSDKSDVAQKFDDFWRAYPTKIKKKDAMKEWLRLAPKNGDFEKIMQALESFKESSQWRSDGGKYIPHPNKWLKDRRFDDDLPAPRQESLV